MENYSNIIVALSVAILVSTTAVAAINGIKEMDGGSITTSITAKNTVVFADATDKH